MTHKSKICSPALTSHIETCHEECSYTPLIVRNNSFKINDFSHEGIASAIGAEVSAIAEEKGREIEEVEAKLHEQYRAISEQEALGKRLPWRETMEKLRPAFADLVSDQVSGMRVQLRAEIVQSAGAVLDLSNPEALLNARGGNRVAEIEKQIAANKPMEEYLRGQLCEAPNLGLFFSESVCYRSEGLTYSPCGQEFSLLPGESINESNHLTTVQTNAETGVSTTDQALTTTTSNDEQESFASSYERELTRTTDVKFSLAASLKGKLPFKVVSLESSLNSNLGLNFNRMMKQVNKSSSSTTRKRFEQVVNSLKTSTSVSQSTSLSRNEVVKFDRSIRNDSASPRTFIRRKVYCKTSVLHRRHNVQLAWMACIDEPGRHLCTPDNIEEKLAEKIAQIRSKWAAAPAPVEFGPRPNDRALCTVAHVRDRHLGVNPFRPSVSAAIPNGWSYIGGSETSHVTANVHAFANIGSRPTDGARGTVTFLLEVFANPTSKSISAWVCFQIRSDEAAAWDNRVNAWRNEQAQKEIDALIEAKKAELETFLASDQAHATIVRLIMEKYFGVSNITDCCALIAKLHRLFDFDRLCYTLLPIWNSLGQDMCQRSNPVTLYTAKCLHAHIPIRAGMESEALAILAGAQAIPYTPALIPQYAAYIAQINTMRADLYDRAFDASGWQEKVDAPRGYEFTPYTTENDTWQSGAESDLNYELIQWFAIDVPTGAERIDERPQLCPE